MALIKKSELAEKLGVSRPYISKLIREGKLKVIDGLVDENALEVYKTLKEQIFEAKLCNQLIKNDILRMKVKDKESRLIPREHVNEALTRMGKKILDAFSEMIDRVSPIIATTNSDTEVYNLLTNEIRATLTKICENARR